MQWLCRGLFCLRLSQDELTCGCPDQRSPSSLRMKNSRLLHGDATPHGAANAELGVFSAQLGHVRQRKWYQAATWLDSLKGPLLLSHLDHDPSLTLVSTYQGQDRRFLNLIKFIKPHQKDWLIPTCSTSTYLIGSLCFSPWTGWCSSVQQFPAAATGRVQAGHHGQIRAGQLCRTGDQWQLIPSQVPAVSHPPSHFNTKGEKRKKIIYIYIYIWCHKGLRSSPTRCPPCCLAHMYLKLHFKKLIIVWGYCVGV